MSEERVAATMDAVEARMRAALLSPEPALAPLYGWLRYALGWAEIDGRPAEARRAKGVRPRVCLTACAAVGGALESAVDAAAAIELTHEFSLIHDDIEDDDRTRRGRSALWTEIGVAQGINAGDALFGIARSLLSGEGASPRSAPPPDRRLSRLRRYDAACVALAEGQYLDLAFERAATVSPEDYVTMVARKTGALLGAAAALGALSGGADDVVADGLARWGELVGVAFQMRDDWLGLFGDPEHTGKPAGADLVRRKKSLPVLLGLEDPALGEPLAALLAAEVAPEAAERMVDRMRVRGLDQRVASAARARAEQAIEGLAPLALRSAERDALVELARGAADRAR